MIKVNIITRTAERAAIPAELIGLLPDTLRNLQTALDPVPEHLLGIEFWPEMDETPSFNSGTHQLGDEMLALDVESKTVKVIRAVVPIADEVIAQHLADAKRTKLQLANEQCDLRINVLTSTYPATEVLTFSKQEAEARAYQANAAAATPMIDALSVNRGIDKAELTGRIIAKADLFAQYTGMIVGYRQALEDAINAATTTAAVDAIDPTAGWPA